MTTLARTERLALADLLDEIGPDAPTLCGDWTTRDLAAHLVVRERRPDTMPGIAVQAMSGWTEQVQDSYAERPYEDLVELVRTGPGRMSPFALPGADKMFNASEYAVHHEDVRRAQRGWTPRDLPVRVQDSLVEDRHVTGAVQPARGRRDRRAASLGQAEGAPQLARQAGRRR